MRLPNYNQRLLTIEKRTQRFLLGAIGVLLLVLLMIAVKQNYFHRSTTILFFTPNAQGLSKGMAVKFIGFKVGSVEDVSMQSNATVQVEVSLDNEYVHLIGQDAKARLVKEALVGESVVEIIPGFAAGETGDAQQRAGIRARAGCQQRGRESGGAVAAHPERCSSDHIQHQQSERRFPANAQESESGLQVVSARR